MRPNIEKIKETVTATLKEKIGVACTIHLVIHSYPPKDSTPCYAVLNIIFSNREKHPKEFKDRATRVLRELFKELTVGPTKVLLNRIIWR